MLECGPHPIFNECSWPFRKDTSMRRTVHRPRLAILKSVVLGPALFIIAAGCTSSTEQSQAPIPARVPVRRSSSDPPGSRAGAAGSRVGELDTSS